MMKMEREIFGDLFSFFGRAIVDVGGTACCWATNRAPQWSRRTQSTLKFSLSHTLLAVVVCCVLLRRNNMKKSGSSRDETIRVGWALDGAMHWGYIKCVAIDLDSRCENRWKIFFKSFFSNKLIFTLKITWDGRYSEQLVESVNFSFLKRVSAVLHSCGGFGEPLSAIDASCLGKSCRPTQWWTLWKFLAQTSVRQRLYFNRDMRRDFLKAKHFMIYHLIPISFFSLLHRISSSHLFSNIRYILHHPDWPETH